jgi:hypothetical protein
MPSYRSTISRETAPKPSTTFKTETPIQKPSISPSTKPEVLKPLETPLPQPPISKPTENEIKPVDIPEQVIKPEIKQPETKHVIETKPVETPIVEEPKIQLKKPAVSEIVEKPSLAEGDPLKNEIETLLNNIGTMTGDEVSQNLEKIKTIITETRGYSGVLKPINLTISTLKSSGQLSETELSQLISKISFWRRKLNV